jgi:hypothetical protein
VNPEHAYLGTSEENRKDKDVIAPSLRYRTQREREKPTILTWIPIP